MLSLLILSLLSATKAETETAFALVVVMKTYHPELPDSTRRRFSADSPFSDLVDGLSDDLSMDGFEQPKLERQREKIWIFTARNIHGRQWCPNCAPYIQRIRDEVKKKDLPIDIIEDDDAAPGEQIYPAVRMKSHKGEWFYPAKKEGRNYIYDHPPDASAILKAVDKMREAEEKENTKTKSPVAQGILNRTFNIRGREVAQLLINKAEKYMPASSSVSFQLSRSGVQEVSVLRKATPFSVFELLGSSGRLSLSFHNFPSSFHVPEHVSLPYQVRGDDFGVGLDMVFFPDVASLLGRTQKEESSFSSSRGPPVYGIDPLTVWTVFSLFRAAVSFFNPSCDVSLPGDIGATITCADHRILIEMERGVRVRFSFLLRFNLELERMELTEDFLRLHFLDGHWVPDITFSFF